MALEVNMFPDQPTEAVGLIADRRLLLTADRDHVVDEDDTSGASLLAALGRMIPAADVKRLGLSADKDGRVLQLDAEPEPKAAAPEPEVKEQPKPDDKQRKKPADKAVKKPATKRRRKRAT